MVKKVTEEIKDFFHKWGIQYVLWGVGSIGSEEKEKIKKDVKAAKEKSEQAKPQKIQTAPVQPGVVSELKQTPIQNISVMPESVKMSPSQEEETQPSQESMDISSLSQILLQEKEIPTETASTEEITQKKETDLERDIRISLEGKEEGAQVFEVGEIFKKNEKLLKLLSNNSIIEDPSGDFLVVDGKYIAYMGYFSLNSMIDTDLLRQLNSEASLGEFTIHDFYVPLDSILIRKQFEKSLRGQRSSSAIQLERTGNVQRETHHQIFDLDSLISILTANKAKMYNYYSVFRLMSDTKDELLEKAEFVKILLQKMNLDPLCYKHLQYRVHESFWLGGNTYKFQSLIKEQKIRGILSTHNELAGVAYKYDARTEIIDETFMNLGTFLYKNDNNVDGILLGEDYWTKKIINRDLWAWDNKNTILCGTSGTGKSYTAKLVCLREYIDGVKQIILDPDNEFEALTKQIGGKYINIGYEENDKDKINPFDFIYPRILFDNFWEGLDEEISSNHDSYLAQVEQRFNVFVTSLKQLVNIVLSKQKLSDDFYVELSSILNDFFKDVWGVERGDIRSYFEVSSKPLNIQHFYQYIIKQRDLHTDAPERYKLFENIRKGLYDYGDEMGTYFNIFGKQRTGLDFSSNWTAFNLKQLWGDKGLKSVVVFTVMEFIKTIFSEKQVDRVRLTIDEATTFIGDTLELADYIAELYKVARKYNIWVTLIVQGIKDLYVDFSERDGKGVNYGDRFLQNTANKIILPQEPVGLALASDKLKLSSPQQGFLHRISTMRDKKARRGIALVMTGNSVDQIRILSEEYIHKYITTDPDEIQEMRRAAEAAKAAKQVATQ